MAETISVIIPVYNERKYLKKCVDSILCQTWKNMDIIIVDDGSEQDVAKMCDALGARDDRIRVIHQKNGGSAAARENGVQEAEGKWIAFVDADDMMADMDALRQMAECGEKTDADIVVGNYRKLTDSGVTSVKEQEFFQLKDQDSTLFRFRGFIQNGHLAYEWAKLYRRDFLTKNHIHHTSYPFTQDRAFNLKCYLACPNYAFVDSGVYLYRVNRDSITFSYKKNFKKVWISIGKEIDAVMMKNASGRQCRDIIAFHFLLGLYYYGKQEILKRNVKAGEIMRMLKEYMNDLCVWKYIQLYFCEKYGDQVGDLQWKIFFDILAFLVKRKWAGVTYVIFKILLALQIESRISEGSYRKAANHSVKTEKVQREAMKR